MPVRTFVHTNYVRCELRRTNIEELARGIGDHVSSVIGGEEAHPVMESRCSWQQEFCATWPSLSYFQPGDHAAFRNDLPFLD